MALFALLWVYCTYTAPLTLLCRWRDIGRSSNIAVCEHGDNGCIGANDAITTIASDLGHWCLPLASVYIWHGVIDLQACVRSIHLRHPTVQLLNSFFIPPLPNYFGLLGCLSVQPTSTPIQRLCQAGLLPRPSPTTTCSYRSTT